jgi:lipopolysaccharide/colanic/teichoic acid biosynthesis glycosyltransferase
MLKQLFDYSAAFLGLILFSPVIVLLACLIKLESDGPVFYRQLRVGRNGKVFRIHKFRSMYVNSQQGGLLTSGKADKRITNVGRVIRNLHLDEIAQLIDVLQGHMSIVGPRPEVPEYTKIYKEIWERVLIVKPGITGLAALKLSRWEYEMLQKAKDKDKVYKETVLPKKLQLEVEYVERQNFFSDLKIIAQTISLLFKR